MPKSPHNSAHRGIPFELMFGRRKRRDQRPVLRNSTHDARRAPARQNAPHQQFGGFREYPRIRAKLRNQFRTALASTDRVTDWSDVDVDHLLGPASTTTA
jgi:hypothetical protein